MRPIDADALKESTPETSFDIFENCARCGLLDREQVFDLIDEQPTIDAVPVVRCKDCKHRDAGNGLCEGRGWPMQLVPDDGFCDKGERSEE